MNRVLSVLGVLLSIAAVVRLGAVVLHEPMLAIANQYDMVRTGSCVGLYPDLPADKRHAATPQAPLERYRLDARIPGECYLGSETLLAAAVVAKHRVLDGPDAAFPALREIGLLKLVIAGVGILALAAAFWPFPVASVVHGATAFLVMADPVVSLWMQTLYTEFPVLFGAYFLMGALGAGLLREVLPRWLAVIAGTGIVMVAFAKEQFFLLPLLLVAVAAPGLWVASRRPVIVLAVLAALAVAWHALVPRSPSIAYANRADTYLGVVLPASTDHGATLSRLGLSEPCGALSGATWYLTRGANLREECPEVLALRSTAFLTLAFSEPRTLARAVARVVPSTQNPLPGNIGMVAREPLGTIATKPWWLRSIWVPAAMLLPAAWYLGLVLFGLALVFPALVFWAATLRRGPDADAHPFAAHGLMLVLVVCYSMATTVFGDGLAESARHNLPGFVAMAAIAVFVPFALDGIGRVGPWLRVAVGVACLAAIAGAAWATAWALRQPIAIGVLDAPPGREVSRQGFLLRGWALDPLRVHAIRIRVGDQEAKLGRDAFFPSPELSRIYGGYPDAKFANFEFAVPAAWLAKPQVPLRIEAENEAGVVSVIDERQLRPVP